MNIDFSQNICNINGEVMKSDDEGTPVTLGIVAVNALLTNSEKEEKEKSISADEKVKRFLLASKIQSAKEEVSLTVEEVAIIKKTIAYIYTTLVVGRAFELLEKA